MDWPDRGVYFFFASDERRNAGDQLELLASGLTLSPREVAHHSGTVFEPIVEQSREPTKAAGIIEAPFSGNESARRSLSVIP